MQMIDTILHRGGINVPVLWNCELSGLSTQLEGQVGLANV